MSNIMSLIFSSNFKAIILTHILKNVFCDVEELLTFATIGKQRIFIKYSGLYVERNGYVNHCMYCLFT